MSGETRGYAIKARRLRQGVKSVRALAAASGVSREAVTAAEDGNASPSTYDRLEAWLDDREAETRVDQQEGRTVTRRRERLGLDIYELADEAGVNRDTVSAIEAGKGFRRSSLTKIEEALARLEAEVGFDAPPRSEVPELGAHRCRSTAVRVVRLRNDLGQVEVEGAAEDRLELMADAEAMLLALARVARKAREETDRSGMNGTRFPGPRD